MSKSRFVRVADTRAIPENGNKVVVLGGTEVAIFHHEGRFYALANLCPHRQAPLSAGEVARGIVTCPWHGARFELATGKGLPGPHRCNQQAFPVRIQGTEIHLELRHG